MHILVINVFLHNDHQEIIAVTYTENIDILIINMYLLSINKYNASIYVYIIKHICNVYLCVCI